MASTLLEFAGEKKNRYTALKGEAQTALSQATQDLAAAQQAYDSLVSEYAALEKEVKEKRKELDSALMPADIEALADELRDLIIQLRKKRAEHLKTEDEIATQKRALAQAEKQLKRAEEKISESEKELKAAQERAARHTTWKESLSDDGSLSELSDNATALLDELDTPSAGSDPEDPLKEAKALITAAKDRIVDDFPANLLTRARERGEQARTHKTDIRDLIVSIEDEAGNHRESDEGTAGKTAKLWVEFLRAEEAFKDYVLLSLSRYQQALALLKSIKESKALTDAERDRINDAILVSDGEAAITYEKDRDDAQAAVTTKEMDLNLAIAQACAADIDADPEDDTSVQSIRSDLATLKTALTTAEGAYTNEMRDDLDHWEASVPDHIWSNLVAYDHAIALLTEIKDGDPDTLGTALATAMDDAEASLAEAITEQDKGVRTRDYLEDYINLLDKYLDFEKAAQQQCVLSAVRGDN